MKSPCLFSAQNVACAEMLESGKKLFLVPKKKHSISLTFLVQISNQQKPKPLLRSNFLTEKKVTLF